MSDHEEAVRALLARSVSAWTANDANGFASLYAPDATVLLADGTFLSGRDEIRTFMTAGFAGPLAGTRGLDEVASVRSLGDDAAIAISDSGYTFAGEDRPAAGRMRRATWTLTRSADGWAVAGYANAPHAN